MTDSRSRRSSSLWIRRRRRHTCPFLYLYTRVFVFRLSNHIFIFIREHVDPHVTQRLCEPFLDVRASSVPYLFRDLVALFLELVVERDGPCERVRVAPTGELEARSIVNSVGACFVCRRLWVCCTIFRAYFCSLL